MLPVMDHKPPAGWKIPVLCILSALGNILLSSGAAALKAPLYLDTLFTAAITFTMGLWPGLCTGALLYPVIGALEQTLIRHIPAEIVWTGNVFALCTIWEVFLVWFFRAKIKFRQAAFLEEPSVRSFTGVAAQLTLLVAIDCIVISVLGGIIDFILFSRLSAPEVLYPENMFKLGLLRGNVPVLASTILSRIPINIVDRFIVMFGGYGVSLLYRKLLVLH